MKKEGRSVFLVRRFMETAVDWMQARVLTFFAYFLFNLYKKKSRAGKRAVSYTHLDVYKRQGIGLQPVLPSLKASLFLALPISRLP